MLKGPIVYEPQVEVDIVQEIQAVPIGINEALIVTAKADCSYLGEKKTIGESWLVKTVGPYLPGVHEEVGKKITATILDGKKALHVSANNTFVDEKGIKRKAGTQWLVTMNDCNSTYFPGINEKIVQEVELIILKKNDYCIVTDPFDVKTGKSRLGNHIMVKGPTNFFLQPGESQLGIKRAMVLSPRNRIWLTAKEGFVSEDGITRKPGSEWSITGPCVFYPPIEATYLNQSAAFSMEYPIKITIFNRIYILLSVVLIAYLLTRYFGFYE